MKRVLCVWFPRWAVQRLLVRASAGKTERKQPRALLVVAEVGRRGRCVANCCPLASASGVRLGMTVAEATSHLDASPLVFAQDEEGDRIALNEVAERFATLAPRIAVESSSPVESLFLDVAGVLRLHGGESRVTTEAEAIVQALGYRAWMGVADTPGAAWAASRYLAEEGRPAMLPPGDVAPLLALPIESLRLSEDAALAFRRLGVATIRQAAEIPRAALKARFGEEILTRLDQLLDRRIEAMREIESAPEFVANWSSEFPIREGDELFAVLSVLLDRLSANLRGQGRGVTELACTFVAECGAAIERSLRLCEPVASPGDLARLLALELERSPVRGAIGAVSLVAVETARLLPRQRDLFAGGEQRDPSKLGELLDQLGSRLGRENVVRPILVADAVPERSFALVPVSAKGRRRSKSEPSRKPPPRPSRLLVDPLPIEVVASIPDGPPRTFRVDGKSYEVVAASGLERIEAAWWRGETVRRDYWQVDTSSGSRFWLFRRLQDGRWYLHGEFA